MGFDSTFSGCVNIEPRLNPSEISYLRRFNRTRRMNRDRGPYFVDGTGHFGQDREDDVVDYNSPPPGQPGRWCGWTVSDDGGKIVWDETEKFYHAADWLRYLIGNFLAPHAAASRPLPDGWIRPEEFRDFTFDHVCNGRFDVESEDEEEGEDGVYVILVRDNVVR